MDKVNTFLYAVCQRQNLSFGIQIKLKTMCPRNIGLLQIRV